MLHKIGDKFQLHCYKHNGKIHSICEESTVIEETDDYLICGNYKTMLFEDDGNNHRTKEPAIIIYYKHHWFNIMAQFKEFGLFYYCNIASPYIWDDNVLKYIDYDLDLRVFPDGSFRILDRNEYNYHKKIMHYSKELEKVIEKELQNLIKMKKNNEGPFNIKVLNEYLEKYKSLQN